MNVLFKVKDSKLTKKFRWIQSAEYKNNNGLAIIEFSNAVMPYLCQLEKQFTNYQLRSISGFNRTYSIRLLLDLLNPARLAC